MGKIVEIAGLPGSGKTLFVRKSAGIDKDIRPIKQKCGEINVERKLKKKCLQKAFHAAPDFIKRKLSKKYYNVRFNREENNDLIQFSKSYESFLDALIHIISQKASNSSEFFLFLRTFQTLMVDYQSAVNNMKSSEYILLEEGFMQKCLSLKQMPEIDSSDINAYLNHCPHPDIFIVIDCPIEASISRICQRGWPANTSSLSHNLAEKLYLHRYQEALDAITEELPKKNIPLLTFDNSSNSGMRTNDVQLLLQRMISA